MSCQSGASTYESWAQFRARHPNEKVLVPNNPGMRPYGRNPYVNYDLSARPFLFNGDLPDNIPAMARVVVVKRDDDTPVILSMNAIKENGSHKTEGLVFNWIEGQASALHSEDIASGREVGTITVFSASDGKLELVPYDVTFAFVAHAFYPDVAIQQ